MDLRGYPGLDESARPGYDDIIYTVRVKTDAPAEVIEELLRASERRSPMFDNIRNGVRIRSVVEVEAPEAGVY